MPRWEIQAYPAPVLGVRGHEKLIIRAISVQHALDVALAKLPQGYLVYSVTMIWD